MKRCFILKIFVFVLIIFTTNAFSQVKDYKNLPDFDYNDYSYHLKFMTAPYSLIGQTLYLENVNDSLQKYFFTGELQKPYKDVYYYHLARIKPEHLAKMKGEWFIVKDYVADQFAFQKMNDADIEKQNFKAMPRDFIKLAIPATGDTVFYNYNNFWNRYNFPFIPMSYFNNNKNEYPNSKYAKEDLSLIKYDTNANYAYLPEKLVGQKLILPVVSEKTCARLFNGVKLYNYDDDSRKYSFTDYPIAKAKLLEGKTFIVTDWGHNAAQLTDVYLKLVLVGGRDTIYYKYPPITERTDFDFVIESFLNKMKMKYKDMDFVYRGQKFPLSVIDIRRKRALTLKQGDVFHCLDFVIKDGKFQMLMRNEKGRKFYMPADYNIGDKLTFERSLALANNVEKYKNTYPTYFKAILQKELIEGMTQDMTQQSWGKPERNVPTNFDESNRHWFYMGNIYIIFRNNKLHRVAMIPKELR
ncbi:MAG: hypothetical protein LBR28_01145 [Bacteroidales bacterium]|jgi:hypothetical protein|nr:hypothetical protein [Bacteroidales bacterium]